MSAQPKTAMERPLPNNYEAERAVLGAVLLDNKTFESARAKITTGDFFDDRHKRIFHAMTDMRACQSPIDLLTITDFLEGKRLLTLAGGPSYVASLTDGVPQITNVEHYAAIVKEKSLLRGLIHAGHAVEMSAFEQGANYDVK
jgi:replicative DNA helicase